jgi:hypothetical protein
LAVAFFGLVLLLKAQTVVTPILDGCSLATSVEKGDSGNTAAEAGEL